MAYRALTNLFGQDIHDHMIIVFTGADVYGSTIGVFILSFFLRSPAISLGFTILGEIFAYVTVF